MASTRREQLAVLWCNWNGQRGTVKQVARIRCTEDQLERMLAERGVSLGANGEMVITRKPAAETCWCGCGSTQPHQTSAEGDGL